MRASGIVDDVGIRSASRSDGPVLGRLGALLVSVHHGFDADRFIAVAPGTEAAYAAFLSRQLGRTDSVVLVAERAGAVLVYAFAGIEGIDFMALRGPAAVLHDLVVDPAHRRAGVGRKLLEAMLAALAVRGAPRVVLSTAERNEAAQRLFAAVGFRLTMVEMTRELPGPQGG